MKVEKVSRTEIKDILESNKAKAWFTTITIDGSKRVAECERISSREMAEEAIDKHNPSELHINIHRSDGSSGTGKPKFKLMKQYEVDLNPDKMNGVEEDLGESKSSIEDATIVEDRANDFDNKIGANSSEKYDSIYHFAFEEKKIQLQEAKSKIHQLEIENKNLTKDLNKCEKEILQHESNVKELQKDLEKAGSWSEKASGMAGIVASDPNLSKMVGGLLGNLLAGGIAAPNNGAMAGASSPHTAAINEWILQQDPATQQIIFDMWQSVAKSYDEGNRDILNMVINHVNSVSESASPLGDSDYDDILNNN